MGIPVVYVDDEEHTANEVLRDIDSRYFNVEWLNPDDIADVRSGQADTIAAKVVETEPAPRLIILDLFRKDERGEMEQELWQMGRMDLVRRGGTGLQCERILRALRTKTETPVVVVSDRPPTDAVASHLARAGASWVLHKGAALSLSRFLRSLVEQYNSRRVILLIDDSRATRSQVKQLLEGHGFDVRLVVDDDGSCDEALAWKALVEADYDHAILDLLLDEESLRKGGSLEDVAPNFFTVLNAGVDEVLDDVNRIPSGQKGGFSILHRRMQLPEVDRRPVFVVSRFVTTDALKALLRGHLRATDAFFRDSILSAGQEQTELLAMLAASPEELQ